MIVSNAIPLIYLSKVGKLELLKRVFGKFRSRRRLRLRQWTTRESTEYCKKAWMI